jgi:hypothetical protein
MSRGQAKNQGFTKSSRRPPQVSNSPVVDGGNLGKLFGLPGWPTAAPKARFALFPANFVESSGECWYQ